MTIDPRQVLPVLIPLLILGVVAMRRRKPQRIRIERLWITPVLMTALIGMGLMKLGWGFGGGPLLALVLAAVLLRKGRTMGDQGHVVSSGR